MNQAFGINNTTNDITNSGPVAQQLALHKGATIFADMNIVGNVINFPIASLKQGALGTTIIVDILNPGGGNLTTLAIGPSIADLVDQLSLKRVGDCALIHFFSCNFDKGVTTDTIRVDSGVGAPATLFAGVAATDRGGEAVLEIRATNVTPGAEAVTLFSGNNAFV
jgi:hypothetical protein